ncbi:kinase-like domain-containing protein [Aspergillus caelatus]|uniref:Kinase-like domain-containing protein n=1 Tax=Aspergillus caelatus TaxID=61420 RepID=A0A5N6ZQC8_9EURO|nr:kinase-like domain-containing protein [Aspergillus caelatus]KAE8359588.1 kinase-like domain-containing protein [Aspergillus caelatus]
MAHITIQDEMEKLRCSSSHTKTRSPSPKKTEKYIIQKLSKEFELTNDTIGDGSFARVKIVQRKEQGTLVRYAAKFLNREEGELERLYVDRALEEFKVARSLHHPNIVEVLSLCKHKLRLAFVMEYCQHGDLLDLMERRTLCHGGKKCLFKQMLRGVVYMHSHGIAHHDIKPENMVLANDNVLKIIDFGLSEVFAELFPPNSKGERELGRVREFPARLCGTAAYLPPEVFEAKYYYDARALDVWSCAITAFALFVGKLPWGLADDEDERYQAFQGSWQYLLEEYPDIPVTVDNFPLTVFAEVLPEKELVTLLLRMLHPFPEMRMTIFDALEDPWVQAIECCSPESNHLSAVQGDKAGDCGIPKMHDHCPSKDKLVPKSD